MSLSLSMLLSMTMALQLLFLLGVRRPAGVSIVQELCLVDIVDGKVLLTVDLGHANSLQQIRYQLM